MGDSDRVGGRLPGPTLHRLVHQERYTEALEHFRERPQDAKYRDGTGENVLGWMCKDSYSEDLLHLIEEIVTVFPFLVEQRNDYGYTPMHRAAHYMKKDGPFKQLAERRLLLLIQACPKGVSTPISVYDYANTPFHFACEKNASLDLLKCMLAIDSSLAARSRERVSWASRTDYPLFILWEAMGGSESPGEWPKMELLLRAATGAPLEEITDEEEVDHDRNHEQNQPDRFDVLRAACMVNPCPREYFEIILQRYSNRLSWADERGLLPLHHAILSASKEWPRHTEFLLEAMLARYSDAASHPFGKHDNTTTTTDKDRSPLLPLHVLISDSEMTWHQGGVKDLTFAHPEALKIPDPRNRLVPALSSAPLAIQSRQHLSTTYELLRLTPEIFQDCLANPDGGVNTDEWPFH